jgi:MFS family permease
MAEEIPASQNMVTASLWRHADFVRLWTGQTISVFGSMVGRSAMAFTAILVLQASPFQLGLLNSMELIPAVLTSLFAGAWVDRLLRRPLLIGADLGRALALSTVPIAAIMGILHIEQVYLVALIVSILTIFFDVAYQSYLPGLVGREGLMEGNSKLSASAAVAEFGGFSLGGWLVQIFTAPFAMLIDAGSFVVSAISVWLIRSREPAILPSEHPNMRREIVEGMKTVWHQPLLRASAIAVLVGGLGSGVYGALVVLYMSRGLDFNPGLLGMIWAIGGVSSFLGASLTPRLSRRLGTGRAMVFGLGVFGMASLFVPLASGPTVFSAACLIAAQLGDGFYILYEINLVSLRQNITAEHLLGRVNATTQFINLGATLAGSLLGGLLGEALGVRPVLLIGAGCTLLAALALALSPIHKLR